MILAEIASAPLLIFLMQKPWQRPILLVALSVLSIFGFAACSRIFKSASGEPALDLRAVRTLAGIHREIGEPFGIAVKDGQIYVSDGERGKIIKIGTNGEVWGSGEGLSTPSSIAFTADGRLIVADTGSNTIKCIYSDGHTSVIAGVVGQRGFADGDAVSALFNGPIGLAIREDGAVVVSDTYNDRIRLIRDGKVTTLAGSEKGFSDGIGPTARFDTPLGVAVWHDKIIVADAGNARLRVIEPDGTTSTLAGTGERDIRDGTLASATFYRPSAVAIGPGNTLFLTDGNAIRAVGLGAFPLVQTVSSVRRGLVDGPSSGARFNRPSGIAIVNDSVVIADSENQLVRVIGNSGHEVARDEIAQLRYSADEFRSLAPGRWPFDPPSAKREIAGTLGEIRGEIKSGSEKPVWFHNGLDIAGGYGETAKFVRTETVLDPLSVENVGGPRELIRLPTIGYIHIRLGRDRNDRFFPETPFQATLENGKLNDLRVPRGTRFEVGEPIGTLNSLNHVHLIAGRTGSEINALAALSLPGISDTIAPTIEGIRLFSVDWSEIETGNALKRIILNGPNRVVVRAYDRVDGNSDRRRLGVYKLGYQILKDGTPVSEPRWNIEFVRMPPNEAVHFVYAEGSRSGYTPDTVFDYIVTNRVSGDEFGEGFLDPTAFDVGYYVLRVMAADFFGNTSYKDINFEVTR